MSECVYVRVLSLHFSHNFTHIYTSHIHITSSRIFPHTFTLHFPLTLYICVCVFVQILSLVRDEWVCVVDACEGVYGSGSATHTGVDLITAALFPHMCDAIAARIPFVFASGIADVFHKACVCVCVYVYVCVWFFLVPFFVCFLFFFHVCMCVHVSHKHVYSCRTTA